MLPYNDPPPCAGCVLFVPAATQLSVSAARGAEPMLLWAAAVNGAFFSLCGVVHGGGERDGKVGALRRGGVDAVPKELTSSMMAN